MPLHRTGPGQNLFLGGNHGNSSKSSLHTSKTKGHALLASNNAGPARATAAMGRSTPTLSAKLQQQPHPKNMVPAADAAVPVNCAENFEPQTGLPTSSASAASAIARLRRQLEEATQQNQSLQSAIEEKETSLSLAREWAAVIGRQVLSCGQHHHQQQQQQQQQEALLPLSDVQDLRQALKHLLLALSSPSPPSDTSHSASNLRSLAQSLGATDREAPSDKMPGNCFADNKVAPVTPTAIAPESPAAMDDAPLESTEDSLIEEVSIFGGDSPMVGVMVYSPALKSDSKRRHDTAEQESSLYSDNLHLLLGESNAGDDGNSAPSPTFEPALPAKQQEEAVAWEETVFICGGASDDDDDDGGIMEQYKNNTRKRSRASFGGSRRSTRVAKRLSMGESNEFLSAESPSSSPRGDISVLADSTISSSLVERVPPLTSPKKIPSSPRRTLPRMRQLSPEKEEAPQDISSAPVPASVAGVKKTGRRSLTSKSSLMAPPCTPDLEGILLSASASTARAEPQVPGLSSTPASTSASLPLANQPEKNPMYGTVVPPALQIVQLSETWFGVDRARKGGVAALIFSAARLMTEADTNITGTATKATPSGTPLDDDSLVILQALIDAELCAMEQLPQGSAGRRVGFRCYDLSSVDMPSDFAAKSDVPSELAVKALQRVMDAEEAWILENRGRSSSSSKKKGFQMVLPGLQSIACYPSSSKLCAEILQAFKIIGAPSSYSERYIAVAAAFYREEICAILSHEVDGSSQGQEGPQSPLQQRLVVLLSSLLRYQLRRLLNPPPLTATAPSGLGIGEQEMPGNRSQVWTLFEMVVPETCPFQGLRDPTESFAGISEGMASCVLSHALEVVCEYKRRREMIEKCRSECEEFLDSKYLRKATKDDVSTVIRLFLRLSVALAARRAREFILRLLEFPGLKRAIDEEGGWGPVEDLARSLKKWAVNEDDHIHMAQLANLEALTKHLHDPLAWEECEAAERLLVKLIPWVNLLGQEGPRRVMEKEDAHEFRDEVSKAVRASIFPLLLEKSS